jgi:hypothetical protein
VNRYLFPCINPSDATDFSNGAVLNLATMWGGEYFTLARTFEWTGTGKFLFPQDIRNLLAMWHKSQDVPLWLSRFHLNN